MRVATPSRPRALFGVALLFAACGGDGDDDRTDVSVFAASSLTEAFRDLERRFEADNPDVDVEMVFAGSQVLRLQIEQGAEADVFASANEAHMAALTQAGLVERSGIFAHNELVVVVPPDNPADIGTFEDLPRASRLVLGTDNVPVGIYARQVIEGAASVYGEGFVAAVLDRVVSEESNVRLVRAKVELGEADAAIVYRTDATVSSNVAVVPIPAELNVRAGYPIGVVSGSRRLDEARPFVSFVLSPRGQEVLARHGFVPRTP